MKTNEVPPPGAMVELSTDIIDEGKFKRLIDAKIREGVAGVLAFERAKAGDVDMPPTIEGTKSTVTLSIEIERFGSDFMIVGYSGKVATPTMKYTTHAKEVRGKLLCQPAGSNDGDPDQQLFYDTKGRIIGGEPSNPAVAGRIAQA